MKEAGAEGVVPKTAGLEAENADLRARLQLVLPSGQTVFTARVGKSDVDRLLTPSE